MTVWWDQDRISATLSQTFIEKELGSRKHQDTLHRVLAFGDGLTDDTYLDWILERSPRFFLILNDVGVPEKIFDVIDRSFDDDDLPLSQDALWELNLFGTTSETLDKKFYRQQFCFLIQDLEPGGHVDYGAWDVVPVEPALKKPSLPAAVQCSDRIFTQGHLYTRKRIPTSGDNGIDRIRFVMHLKSLATLQHQHLVTVWATYSQNDFNYVLLKPPCDVTLRHVLEDKDLAKQFKCLEKHERRQTLLTWVHCLISALAYLHSRGFIHKSIRPSTISIDHDNVIYLNDYDALRVLDVEESPNPYSGELYDYAPPENWLRKPTLHETAPLKTVLPGGGRTSRRVPKAPHHEPSSRRPSLTGDESIQRPHSRSQNSSSGSSTNARPRNALITTFAPPETTPLLFPGKYFPADIFSLAAVILTILSYLLGHAPKAFASYRCRLNRQAGRGNGPPDASFHKNPNQVEKWIEMLIKEAGQKEKKDQKLWGSIVELTKLCKAGTAREPEDRLTADELERKTLRWVDFGIGRRRKCECSEQDRSFEEPQKPNPVLAAQRDSILSWSKISERLSSGLYSDDITSQPAVRPLPSLSQRLTLDPALEVRGSRCGRPRRGMSGAFQSLASTEEEPASPTAIKRRQSEKIRSAVRNAVQPTPAQHMRRHPNFPEPTVVHQGRSAYRLRPKKTAPMAGGRRATHPIDPSQHSIREEPSEVLDEQDVYEVNDRIVDDEQTHGKSISAYTLKPRRKIHSMPTTNFPRSPNPDPQDRPVSPSPSSNLPPTPTRGDTAHPLVVHGIPIYDEEEEVLAMGLDASARERRLQRHESYTSTEVWGLCNALEDETDNITLGDLKPRDLYDNDNIRSLAKGREAAGIDWPLPLGTLMLESGPPVQ